MARIIQDDQGGSAATEGQITILKTEGQTTLSLPEGDFISQGDLLRDGQDLVLQSSDGQQVVVEGYFSALPAPTLTTPGGSVLTPELVQSFAHSQNLQYAAADTADDASAIGIIKELSGEATITRADGTSEKATLGGEIHQGDIVETAAEGAVNIVFLDESSFAISSNARMAIDEYVYDPASQGGETNISILRGMFVFTSGLIGRDDPDDVHIDTPVGSIGIRGTTIAGNIQPDGQSQITVVEGAIVIKNAHGEITLADQYQTVTLTGQDQPIEMVGTLDANQMTSSYGVIGTVAPAFMNTLNITPDSETTDAPADAASSDAESESTTEPEAPDAQPPTDEGQDAVPGEEQGQVEADAPVVATYDIYNDPLNSGFEESVSETTTTPFDSSSTTSATLLSAASMNFMTSGSVPLAPTGTTDSKTFSTTTATTTAPPLPPLEIKVEIRVDDDALAGDIVGKVYTTISYPDVEMKFINVPLHNGAPMFELVKAGPGVYNVLLTAAGDQAVSTITGTGFTYLGDVQVAAILPDGRTTEATAPSNHGDFNGTGTLPPPPPLNLGLLSGSEGSVHTGVGTNGLGFRVAYLGDYNNDGTPDYAVSNGGTNSYLLNMSTLPSTATAPRIAGNGDLNGDGHLDFIVGSPEAGSNNGYISLYNGATNTAGTALYGGTGSLRGASLAMIDFNNDGFADVFMGAPGSASGEGDISKILGNASLSFSSAVPVTFDNPVVGGYSDMLGFTMTGLRDYNNDGFGDLAVGRMLSATTGQVIIYSGNGSGAVDAGSNVTLTINDIENFRMPLFDLGDINGDGRSDLMIGQTGYNANNDALVEGRVLISMGGSNTVGRSISAADGAEIVGAGAAGDFNGDGLNDIFVATRTNNIIDAYVIYGGSSLPPALTLDSTWLQNNHSSYMHLTLDVTGWGAPADISFHSTTIGDQNGDGLQDLLIGTNEVNGDAGAYFIVYGRVDAQNQSPTGWIGTTGNDTVTNQPNAFSSFYTGNGNDNIRLYTANSTNIRAIDGGSGSDFVAIADGNINFTNIGQLNSIEKFVFEGASAQTLTLGLNDVFSLLQTSNQNMNAGFGNLFTVVFGDANNASPSTLSITSEGNPVNLSTAGFNNAGTFNDGSNNYNVYTHGSGYQLLIDTDITIAV